MRQEKTVTIKSLAQMQRFADGVARRLKGGEIIGLIGDLGAGKTAFVQALAKSFGVRKAVRSPTFILMQCFRIGRDIRLRTGINELCHIDAYRLEGADELFAIGFGEYAEREDAVTLVEWADLVESISWLEDYREIRFAFGKGEERVLACDVRLASGGTARRK
jgi:tRNA threonylcarbamoyladenosine biosynthesis protein TsaE